MLARSPIRLAEVQGYAYAALIAAAALLPDRAPVLTRRAVAFVAVRAILEDAIMA